MENETDFYEFRVSGAKISDVERRILELIGQTFALAAFLENKDDGLREAAGIAADLIRAKFPELVVRVQRRRGT